MVLSIDLIACSFYNNFFKDERGAAVVFRNKISGLFFAIKFLAPIDNDCDGVLFWAFYWRRVVFGIPPLIRAVIELFRENRGL
jgi:hypothetical protein